MGRRPLSVRARQGGLARNLGWLLAVRVCMVVGAAGPALPDPNPAAHTSNPQGSPQTNGLETLTPRQEPMSPSGRKTFVDLTPAELAKVVVELKHLQPAANQDMLPQILKRVGATVAAFFDTFYNVTCTERVISTVATPMHAVELGYDYKFNYVALPMPGTDKVTLQEFRTDSKGAPVQPQSIKGVVTIGFVTRLNHFHPDYQSDSHFRYLGREEMKGQDTYVVAFAQQPAMARHPAFVEYGNTRGRVFMQGVAWIDPESFRILRLRTDILQPELKVGLQRETTEIEYSEVTFGQGGKTLWLPRAVIVTGQLLRYSFHNRHHYSDYRLFVVKAGETQKGP